MNQLDEILKSITPHLKTSQFELPLQHKIRLLLLDPEFLNSAYSYNESQSVIENTPFWAICWPSGFVIADYIMQNVNIVRGRKIIDIGSGSGIAAIAASIAGASEVTACDHDEAALQAVKLNAKCNNVKIDTCLSPEPEKKYDIAIAADVLYNTGNMHMLDLFLETAPAVLLADSRVGEINHRSYKKIFETQAGIFPDTGFHDKKEMVSIYEGYR